MCEQQPVVTCAMLPVAGANDVWAFHAASLFPVCVSCDEIWVLLPQFCIVRQVSSHWHLPFDFHRVKVMTTLSLIVPSVLVVPKKEPPGPPPFPGTVNPEDLRPPVNPPRPFLRPWKTHEWVDQGIDKPHIPVTIDTKELAAFNERHDVERTVRAVFKEREDIEEMVASVMASLKDPFKGNDSDIVWTLVQAVKPNPGNDMKLGGKKLQKRHKILDGPPWSIVSFGDVDGGVRRNMIYDGDGNAIAQVDMGHGSQIGIHAHALVIGNLAHTPGNSDDHCFELESVPWPWLCIPDVRTATREEAGAAIGAPPVTLDTQTGEMSWIPVTMPYEDYLGERAFSDEW